MKTNPFPIKKVPEFSRITSIDILRGIIMVLMALDHVRDFFHADAMIYDPLDLTKTTPAIFITRWITHLCAPTFIFLAGTSAFLVGQRKSKRELSKFLFRRGIWLVVLELSVINFAWFFNLHFSTLFLIVIWAIGVSMIVLSVLQNIHIKYLLYIGLAIVFGHNLLDGVHFEGSFIWSVIHEQTFFGPYGNFSILVGYPLIPWIGVMVLGYCLGQFYTPDFNSETRRKWLMLLGVSALLLFVILRSFKLYGDVLLWQSNNDLMLSILSFINVSKYPPSLHYLLVTLGIGLVFLSLAELLKAKWTKFFIVFGQVPLFYYILHLYLIHIMAIIAAELTGFSWHSMVLTTWITEVPELKGFGFSLSTVYFIWLLLIVILYPFCLMYRNFKLNNKSKWWLSYL